MVRPKGIPHSIEHRKKLSKIAKQKGFGKWMIGKKLSKEHRNNISIGNKLSYEHGRIGYWKGKKQPRSMVNKRNKKMKGHRVSQETRKKISEKQTGEKNHAWKGGKTSERGYILIKKRDHPFANKAGYVREHRLVIENIIKRHLCPDEHVHHINENPSDNRPENLMLFNTLSSHLLFHRNQNLVNPNTIIFDGRKL